jgi:uncharacterized protein
MTELLILISVLLASFVGTTTGFGTSTILIPILLLFYPLPEVILFVGIIHWFGNLWKMYFFRKGKSFLLLLSFGLAGIIGSFIGAKLTIELSQDILQKILGLFLLAYCVLVYWKPKLKLKTTTLISTVGGLLSGISSGIFGIGGAVRGAFLNAFGLKKTVYLFTAGAIGFMIDSTRLMTYWQQGFRLSDLRLTWLLLGIPISLLGALIAKKLVDYLPQKLFQNLVTTGLLLLGFYYFLVA